MTALRLRVPPPDYTIACDLCGQYLSGRATVTLYDEVHPACLKSYRSGQVQQWRSDRINAWRI